MFFALSLSPDALFLLSTASMPEMAPLLYIILDSSRPLLSPSAAPLKTSVVTEVLPAILSQNSTYLDFEITKLP